MVYITARNSRCAQRAEGSRSARVHSHVCDIVHSSGQRFGLGGVCPPSELTCPPCPWDAPVKCPSGGCAAHARECPPNVWLRGHCNSTVCIEGHWCHVLPRMPYACWEQAPSTHTAMLTFTALDAGRCGTCHHLVSKYICAHCCGTRAVGIVVRHACDRPARS